MRQEHERIFTGDQSDCIATGFSVVHACKSPCHAAICGQKVEKTSPDYLYKEQNGHLYLNMIDPPVPLFKAESFGHFLSYAVPRWKIGQSILIHCNQGNSRSRSLAIVLMAAIGVIPSDSYAAARAVIGDYEPSKGIETFLNEHWAEVMALRPA